jgi:hypothetical protein
MTAERLRAVGRGLLASAVVGPVVAGCVLVSGRGDELRHPADPAPTVTVEDLARHHITDRSIDGYIEFLGSGKARGRNGVRASTDRVAAWVASQFQLAGLHPAGDDGGFVQYWPHANAHGDTIRVANVIAVAPGSAGRLEDEYVVLIARYGHVGEAAAAGGESADRSPDPLERASDAPRSAIAALVAVARAVAALPSPTDRSIVFVAVSGPENEALGARWFAAHPTVRIDRAVAAIGIGEVGSEVRGDEVTLLEVEGYDRSAVGPLLARIAGESPGLGLRLLAASGVNGAGSLVSADHAPLARRAIPTVGLATTPARAGRDGQAAVDEVDVRATTRVARLIFLAAYRLATGADEPDEVPALRPGVGGPSPEVVVPPRRWWSLPGGEWSCAGLSDSGPP